jgi:hypothetical protein
MTYRELLLRPEWKSKRLTILRRDKLCCRHCSNNTILPNLQISQGLLISGPNAESLCYLLFVQSKMQNPIINRTKCFIKKEKTFWEDSYVKKNILIYHENEDDTIIKPIAARQILEQEIHYSDGTPVVLNPMIIANDAKWIFNGTLHVHHEYYKIGLMPWEYEDEALITLCWSCHENLHNNKKVPVFDIDGNEISSYTPCNRCNGAGEFPEYIHVYDGICFECDGAKYYELME